MSYGLYIAYHLLFLLAAVSGAYRARLSLPCYVLGAACIGFLGDSVLPAADLNWYRNVLDELSAENLPLFALANDFEVGWFAIATLVKEVMPEGAATLGMTSFVLLILPLLWPRVRQRVEYLALLLFFPGSFLILFNTVRQGFSEYFILATFLSGSTIMFLMSGMVHRFGFILGFLVSLSRKIPPALLILPTAIAALFFWQLLSLISPENDMQSIYEQLAPSYGSFAAKLALYSIPHVIARNTQRKRNDDSLNQPWRLANRAFVVLLGLTLAALVVNPRLADRIAFYILPLSIFALACSRASALNRTFLYASICGLGLCSLLLGSHREFFDEGVVVTDQLQHEQHNEE